MTDFKSFEEQKPAESISCLLYGAAGTGKTDLVGSCGADSLYIDVGRSSETFHGKSFTERRGKFKGYYEPVTESGSSKNYIVPDTAQAYDKVCDIIDSALVQLKGKIKWIIIDELTAFSRFALNKAMEINIGTNKSQASATSKKWDMVIPGIQDYGAEMSLVKQFLAGTIDLCKANDINIIVVAHERYLYETKTNDKGVKTETDTVKKILPSFTGKKDTDAIPNLFDLVWHTEVMRSGDKYIYRVRTVGDDILLAKTRYGGTFKALETDLSFPDVIKRIKNG